MAKTTLYNLASGLVLDRSVFVGLEPDGMSQCIASIRAENNKPLCVVDSADDFFTHKTLFSFLQAKDTNFVLVNEGLGGFLSVEQINALLGVNNNNKPQQEQQVQDALQKVTDIHQVADAGDVIVNMKPQGYVFAQVPPGWTLTDYMSLGPTKIRRKIKNSDGDGTMFHMSPDAFAKLWIYASKVWAGELNVPVMKFETGVGVKTASIQDDRISLGGNYIRRYEIEQVAKHRGWAIPNAVKIAA